MKKLLSILLLLIIFSCNKNKDLLDYRNLKFGSNYYTLKEYKENNSIKYTFSYDGNLMLTSNVYGTNGITTYEYRYGKDEKPDTIFITKPLYSYYMVPVYSDSVINEIREYYNDHLEYRNIFDYDRDGKIIRITRSNYYNEILAASNFVWVGNNIREYVITYLYVLPPIIYVYDYEYDNRKNPYHNVFGKFNFNLIDYMPIPENNWTSMVGYNKDFPDSKITINNVFSYASEFPFVKQAKTISYDGSRTDTYAEYSY